MNSHPVSTLTFIDAKAKLIGNRREFRQLNMLCYRA